jgi:CheY-like chemotaxis protein
MVPPQTAVLAQHHLLQHAEKHVIFIMVSQGVVDMREKPFIVLMAEDNEHDIIATRRAWKMHHISNPLYIVNDGEECLDFVYRRGRYAQGDRAPEPSILLLDIHMPKMDGLSVLRHIRNDGHMRFLPVVVLTTSKEEEDRLRSYDLGANAYIVKPVGFKNFSEAVRTINLFWELVELPDVKAWYQENTPTVTAASLGGCG